MEGTATEWAAQRLTASDLAELNHLIDQMETAKAEKNREIYVPANRDFHFMIYRAAGSDTLLSLIESLWLQIGPYFNLLKTTDNWHTANIEHRAMHAALARKDGAAAREALKRDIDDAEIALRGLITQA